MITLKTLRGQSGYEIGDLKDHEVKRLSKYDVSKLVNQLDKDKFWETPPYHYDPDVATADGSIWIVEGVRRKKYHITVRDTPKGELRNIGLVFLRAAEMKVEPLY